MAADILSRAARVELQVSKLNLWIQLVRVMHLLLEYLALWLLTLICIRLFSCGTSKDGDSLLVEWNESEGAVKRTYQGFRKRSMGVVQFDTTKNRFLAVGDEFVIKIWDMDNSNLLTTIETDGGLPGNMEKFAQRRQT